MLKEERRFVKSTVFEGITSLRAVFSGIDNGVTDRSVLRVLVTEKRKKENQKEFAWLIHEAERRGFAFETVTEDEISALAVGNSHGGLLAECSVRSIPSLEHCVPAKCGFYVMLEGIEDPYNFGYALRSLYAAGVDGVVLPLRNWMSAAGVVARSSAGASEMLPMYQADALTAAEYFHHRGYKVACADVRTDCTLFEASLSLPLLLVVGGEKRGISRALLNTADIVVKIPYGRDFPAALSAASAATVLGFEIMRQNNGGKGRVV